MSEYKRSIELQAEDRDVTRGDAVTLRLTLLENDAAVSILTGTFSTNIHDKNGGLITIVNASHTIVETTGVNVGRLNIALSAANSANLPVGKRIPIAVQVTIGTVVKWYWGCFDQVRAAS